MSVEVAVPRNVCVGTLKEPTMRLGAFPPTTYRVVAPPLANKREPELAERPVAANVPETVLFVISMTCSTYLGGFDDPTHMAVPTRASEEVLNAIVPEMFCVEG